MPLIRFEPSGKTIRVEPGAGLLDAARLLKLEIEAPCGGRGVCGHCAVRVVAGRIHAEPAGVLSQAEKEQGFALACRSSLYEEDVTVEVLENRAGEGGLLDDEGGMAFVEPELTIAPPDCCPPTRKLYLKAPPPRQNDGLPDIDRLSEAIRKHLHTGNQRIFPEDTHTNTRNLRIRYELPVLRELPDVMRAAEGNVTVTLAASPCVDDITMRNMTGICENGDILQVIGCEAGDTSARHFGIAVDVGTTTIGLQLVDFRLLSILGAWSDYNSQLACGADIISRIEYARRPDRREELRGRAVKTINGLINRAAGHARIRPVEISCAVISGNTTMMHLLLGLNPEFIRIDPYTPTMLSMPSIDAGETGLCINPAAPVIISPAVGSYVGGDITAGILCTCLSRNSKDIDLFMDIGTNGEIVLGNRDFLLAAACSAGPAFEGGGIKCGMRAACGAIERVKIDAATGLADYVTTGGGNPRGICGSGMISLLSELLKTGWMDPAGKLNRMRPCGQVVIEGRRASYRLVSAQRSATGDAIFVDEQDIENIIRAKAALYAACALMTAQAGIRFEDIRKIYIAGGFGRYLDVDAAIAIGLLPQLPRERFHFIGNASLQGSTMALMSRRHRRLLYDGAARMTYLELATTPDYMDQFTAALFLPHTNRIDPNAIGSLKSGIIGD